MFTCPRCRCILPLSFRFPRVTSFVWPSCWPYNFFYFQLHAISTLNAIILQAFISYSFFICFMLPSNDSVWGTGCNTSIRLLKGWIKWDLRTPNLSNRIHVSLDLQGLFVLWSTDQSKFDPMLKLSGVEHNLVVLKHFCCFEI